MIAHATLLKTFNKQSQTNTILQNTMKQVEDIKNSSKPKWKDFSTTYIYYGFSNFMLFTKKFVKSKHIYIINVSDFPKILPIILFRHQHQ